MMRHAFAWLTLCAAAGCVDTTPIHVDESHPDASFASPKPDSGETTSCRRCVESDAGACRAEYEMCSTLPHCVDFLECGLRLGCFEFAQLEDRLTCGKPCIDEYMLTASAPALPGILAVNNCTQSACRDACVSK